MTLEEKGNIVPPIKLNEPMETVSLAVQKWQNVISATHWSLYDNTRPDGADFYVLEKELGHIHLGGEAHLPTTAELQSELVQYKLAQKSPFSKGWIDYQIRSTEDADHALWLFDLNYRRLTGTTTEALLKAIEEYYTSRGN